MSVRGRGFEENHGVVGRRAVEVDLGETSEEAAPQCRIDGAYTTFSARRNRVICATGDKWRVIVQSTWADPTCSFGRAICGRHHPSACQAPRRVVFRLDYIQRTTRGETQLPQLD